MDERNARKYLKLNVKRHDAVSGGMWNILKNLKGKIKSVKQEVYRPNEEKTDMELRKGTENTTLFFNETGVLIKEASSSSVMTYRNFIKRQMSLWQWFDSEGREIQRETTEYDDNLDVQVKTIRVAYDANGKALNSEIREYHPQYGFLTRLTQRKADGTEVVQTFPIERLNDHEFMYKGIHNSYNRYVDDRIVESGNSGQFSTQYASGDGYEEIRHYNNGKLSSSQKHNTEGLLIERSFYDDSSSGRTETFKYDARKNLITIVEDHERRGTQQTTFLRYDDDDLLLEEKVIEVGWDDFYRRYEHDQFGNLIFMRLPRSTDEFRYTYDDHGNWVEKVEVDNGKIVAKWVRKFEYYDIQTHA